MREREREREKAERGEKGEIRGEGEEGEGEGRRKGSEKLIPQLVLLPSEIVCLGATGRQNSVMWPCPAFGNARKECLAFSAPVMGRGLCPSSSLIK